VLASWNCVMVSAPGKRGNLYRIYHPVTINAYYQVLFLIFIKILHAYISAKFISKEFS